MNIDSTELQSTVTDRPGWSYADNVATFGPQGPWKGTVTNVRDRDTWALRWFAVILHNGSARYTKTLRTPIEAVEWAERLPKGQEMTTGHRVFSTVIYAQGDDYNEAEQIADKATAAALAEGEEAIGWPSLYRGTVEWTRALFEHLRQWDYGEPTGDETTDERAGEGSHLSYWTPEGRRYSGRGIPRNGYALTWDSGYSNAALVRIEWRDI